MTGTVQTVALFGIAMALLAIAWGVSPWFAVYLVAFYAWLAWAWEQAEQ